LLLAVALLGFAVRARRVAIAGIAVGGLPGALLVPALRDPEPERPPAGSLTVKVLTLNLWHRNDDVSAVSELIRRERPDIVALIELTPAWSRALAPALRPYRIRAIEPVDGSTGIGLYARGHMRAPKIVRLFDDARPAVEARLDLSGRDGWLLVVRATSALLPGSASERDLGAIAEWARQRQPRSAVCGDLNAAPWTRPLRDVLAKGDLRAALPGGLVAGTWPALVPPLRVAIDGCLVGTGLRARAELGSRVCSDHLPVLVELA
jgi:endonuclease/exonuclease/phosphatase (EEP) superfamily protein YafD